MYLISCRKPIQRNGSGTSMFLHHIIHKVKSVSHNNKLQHVDTSLRSANYSITQNKAEQSMQIYFHVVILGFIVLSHIALLSSEPLAPYIRPYIVHPYITLVFDVYNSIISENWKSFLVMFGAVSVIGELILITAIGIVILFHFTTRLFRTIVFIGGCLLVVHFVLWGLYGNQTFVMDMWNKILSQFKYA